MRPGINSRVVGGVLLAVLILFCSTLANGDSIVLETASLGQPGTSLGGVAIEASTFLGHRFHLESATTISLVGGHLTSGQNGAGGTIFAAIVTISGPTAFPLGLPFAPGEVLATALITVPIGLSQEVLVPLPVTLEAGDYLVLFGSGLFGATGEGGLTMVNPALIEPIFTVYNANNPIPFWTDTTLTAITNPDLTMRIVVQAPVPEAAPLPLLGIGLVLLIWIRRGGGMPPVHLSPAGGRRIRYGLRLTLAADHPDVEPLLRSDGKGSGACGLSRVTITQGISDLDGGPFGSTRPGPLLSS